MKFISADPVRGDPDHLHLRQQGRDGRPGLHAQDRATVPAAEFHYLENAGHQVQNDEPKLCAELITAFMARPAREVGPLSSENIYPAKPLVYTTTTKGVSSVNQIIGGFATSHATALIEPRRWDGFREMVRDRYHERFGDLPPEQPQVATESDAELERRYAAIRDTHDLIIAKLQQLKPDAVILFGNDQNENFGVEERTPVRDLHGQRRCHRRLHQQAGEDLRGRPRHRQRACSKVRCSGASTWLGSRSFSGGKMRAHAHSQVFARLLPDADIPVIPVFINAITPPLPAVKRVFNFGRALAESIDEKLVGKRIVVGASGGLSHFTALLPLRAAHRGAQFRSDLRRLRPQPSRVGAEGELSRVADIPDDDIVDNGDVEFRQGISFFGALPEGLRPERLVYEPFYRGLMGFWAGYWEIGQMTVDLLDFRRGHRRRCPRPQHLPRRGALSA